MNSSAANSVCDLSIAREERARKSPKGRIRRSFFDTVGRCGLTPGLAFPARAIAWLVPAMVVLSPVCGQAAVGGVAKSVHDFSGADWNKERKGAKQEEENGVCSICHQAHSIAPPIIPLWSHETSQGPFTPYQSPTLIAEVGQPGGASLACLSCHDGTVAVNQVTGDRLALAKPQNIAPESLISPDLHTVHPVSFTYDASLAAQNGSLEDPTTYRIGDPKTELTLSVPPVPSVWEGKSLIGQTIDQALLFEHRLECSSCHDVHNQDGNAPGSSVQVRIEGTDATGRNDLLCRTCHIK